MTPENHRELDDIRQMLDYKMRESYKGSDQSYSLWFTRLQLRELDENRAYFVCENAMKHKIINEKYIDFISDCLADVLGYETNVEIGIDTSLAPVVPDDGTVISPLKIIREQEEKEKREKERLEKEASEQPPARDNPYAEKHLSYNDEYTFENFLTGPSNKFAYAAAQNVANNVTGKASKSVNPLFIWGPSGLGKTHLMYAIANRVLENNSSKNVVYVKGEEFMNQLIEAIQSGRTREFRSKYRRADMLLIDDIQYIAGAESTQREFFHTFDALYDDGKQIIITSDRPPKELTSLVDRIKSRFEAGLLADIQPPDYELRLAILRDRVAKSRLDMTAEAIDFIAKNLRENIRQLEGVVKKLSMNTILSGGTVDTDTVINTVPEYLRENEAVSDTIDRTIGVVCRHFSVTPEDVKGAQKIKNIKDARNVAMYAIQEETELSLSQIGEIFNRDHSTIYSNINRVRKQMETDPVFNAKVGEIMKEVRRKV